MSQSADWLAACCSLLLELSGPALIHLIVTGECPSENSAAEKNAQRESRRITGTIFDRCGSIRAMQARFANPKRATMMEKALTPGRGKVGEHGKVAVRLT